MALGKVTFEDDSVAAALSAEIASPPRLLPQSSVYAALLGREDEVAAWIAQQLNSDFVPSSHQIVAANKGGHGVRPIAVLDLPSRIAYRVLADDLALALPEVPRSRSDWERFRRAPLERPGSYIVGADIAACYQQIGHELLAEELLVQTGRFETVDALRDILYETSGSRQGIPQQSRASDLIAEPFLARLERSLVRRGLQTDRYNDDFLFTCPTWSEAVRSIEVLEEEARRAGLIVNDQKTVTWRRETYEDQLNASDELRRELAEEAELDLTQFDTDPYDGTVITEAPSRSDVDTLSAIRILERWESVAGTGDVSDERRREHRAVVELIPLALATLQQTQEQTATVLDYCTNLLRFERTMTPSVGEYLASREDDELCIAAFDSLLTSETYLNGWQTLWLQQPIARLPGFATGEGSEQRLDWEQRALTSAEFTPVLRAEVARTLARHKQIELNHVLTIYDRTTNVTRPVLAAAIALLEPPAEVKQAIVGESALHAWSYEWAESLA